MMAILEQVVRVNVLWSLALLGVSAVMAALRVRSPRTRYNVAWAAYCVVLPATLISMVFRPRIVVTSSLPAVGGTDGVFAAVSSSAFTPLQVAALVLAALMMAGLIHFVARWAVLSRRTKQLTPCDDPRVGSVIEQLKSDLGVITGVSCYQTDSLSSPCSLGLRRPAIVIARDVVDGVDEPTLVHIIAHELVHIRHRDYARNLVQKLIRSLFFFNPIAHVFDSRLDELREIACDRDVIEAAGIDRRAYARTLLEMGIRLRGQWAGSPSVTLLRHRSNLMRRISCMRVTNTRDRAVKATVLSTLVVIAFVIIACSNSQEVAAPTASTPVSPADVALGDKAALHESGRMVFISEDGTRHLVERQSGGTWTDEQQRQLRMKLNALHERAADGDLSKEERAKIDDVVRRLHAEGATVPEGHSAFFIDESGIKTQVEVKPGADGKLHWEEQNASGQ